MFVQLHALAGVLAVLTVVPGPDRAVVTKRAAACGRRDGPRTVRGITAGLLTRGVFTVAGPAAVLAASAAACTAVKPAGAACRPSSESPPCGASWTAPPASS